MNAITFAMKQAHVRATWMAIEIFKAAAIRMKKPFLDDMTPARFDILQAVWLHDGPHHERRAAEGLAPIPRWRDMEGLVLLLGLAASTVSRGVKRLVGLGWVEVRRVEYDRRKAEVYLTEEGLEALAAAKVCLEREPRAMPGFVEEDESRPLSPAVVPDDATGMNDRMRRLIPIDRIAEVVVESHIKAASARSGPDGLAFADVMNHHFFRVVDHVRRIARFFRSRARPIHDPRDARVFVLHAEKQPR